MLQLSLLVITSCLGCTFQELYTYDEHPIHTGNFILIMDHPKSFHDVEPQKEFKAMLCEMFSKICFAAAYVVTINRTFCQIESFCWSKNGSYVRYYQIKTHPYQGPDNSTNLPHFTALSTARKLITASGGYDLSLIVMVSHAIPYCQFFGCSFFCSKSYECTCFVSDCYMPHYLRDRYTKQLNNQIKKSVAQNTRVVIFGIGSGSFAAMAPWTDECIHKVIPDYDHLSEYGRRYLRGIIKPIKPKTVHPVGHGRPPPITTKAGMSTVSEHSTSLTVTPSVKGTTSEAAINVSTAKGSNVECKSSQVEWWMILLWSLGLAIIFMIGFIVLFVVSTRNKAANCSHCNEIRRPSEPWKPNDFSESLAAKINHRLNPDVSRRSIPSLAPCTYDKTETVPSYLKEKEYTMSQNVDRCSSEFPSKISIPDV